MPHPNAVIGQRFLVDIATEASIEAMDELIAEDFVYQSSSYDDIRGRQAFKEFIREHHVAQPDLHYSIEGLVANDESVVVQWTSYGTHEGEFLGNAATQVEVVTPGISILHIEDGQIARGFTIWDALSAEKQMAAATGPSIEESGSDLGRPDVLAAAEQYFRVLVDEGNLDQMADVATEDYVGHYPGIGDVVGLESFRELMEMYNATFSGRHMEIERAVVEGDSAALVMTFTGTHSGPISGVEATGKRVSVREISVLRIRGGRVAEQWVAADDLGLLTGLGAVASTSWTPEGSAGGES